MTIRKLAFSLLWLLSLSLPKPALAQPATSPPGNPDICANAVDFDLFARESRARWLARSVPVADNDIAQQTSFAVLNRPAMFGPEIRRNDAGDGYVIELPAGYVARHCRMVATSWIAAEGETDLFEKIRVQVNACENESKPLPACLDSALSSHWGFVRERIGTRHNVIAGVIESSLDTQLLHEFAHAALGHLQQDNGNIVQSEDTLRKKEFDADTYGLTFVGFRNGVPLAAIYNYYLPANVIEETESSHDSHLCRFSDAMFVGQKIGFARMAATSYPNDEGSAATGMETRRKMIAEIAAGDSRWISDFKRNPRCVGRIPADISEYLSDLIALGRFQNDNLDRLPVSTDVNAASAYLERILKIPLQTANGRSVRMHIFSRYLHIYNIESNNPAFNSVSLDAIKQDSARFVSADFGRVLGMIGINLFHALPQMPKPGENNDIIHTLLDQAVKHNNRLSEAYTVHALLYLRERKCEQAVPKIRLAMATAASENPTANSLAAILRKLEGHLSRGESCFPVVSSPQAE